MPFAVLYICRAPGSLKELLHTAQCISLDTDNLDEVIEVNDVQHPSGLDRLERALRQLATLPLEGGKGAGLRRINELVLVGELTGAERLEEALKEVLRK